MRAVVIVSRSSTTFAAMAAWIRSIRMAWARRKILGELASLDEHLLRDMGITRQDLESVLADPGLEDPTLRLALRAREARYGRRASALEARHWAAMVSEADKPAAPEPDCRAA